MIALIGRITVNRAFGAGALALLKRTALKPRQGIIKESGAALAGSEMCMVMVPAVSVDHQGEGTCLPPHSGGLKAFFFCMVRL